MTHNDTSNFQLGAVTSQDNKPLAYCTLKLNLVQNNYTVGEKELLGIVEGLKVFENVLRGMEIIVYNKHLNLLYAKDASQRMVRWRLLVEEFAPKETRHIVGEDNAVTDCFSRMEMEPGDFNLIEIEPPKPMLEYCNMLHSIEQLNTLKEKLKVSIDKVPFPQSQNLISKTVLKKLIKEDDKNHLSVKTIEGVKLAHYKNKRYIPDILKEFIVEWYHKILVHPGTSRLEATLRKDVEHCCKYCHMC